MKCVKCGNALEAGARFCGACGTQQPGAVIPQAAVRNGAKTLFQGWGVGSIPSVKAPEAPRPIAPAAPVAVPDKKGPVSSAMSFAATMAPGSVEMKAIAPPTAAKAPGGGASVPVGGSSSAARPGAPPAATAQTFANDG